MTRHLQVARAQTYETKVIHLKKIVCSCILEAFFWITYSVILFFLKNLKKSIFIVVN